jgi:hypothetical protein
VLIKPGSGGSDPQTPRRLGECPPPVGEASALAEPPLKGFGLRRWSGLTADLLVCGMRMLLRESENRLRKTCVYTVDPMGGLGVRTPRLLCSALTKNNRHPQVFIIYRSA